MSLVKILRSMFLALLLSLSAFSGSAFAQGAQSPPPPPAQPSTPGGSFLDAVSGIFDQTNEYPENHQRAFQFLNGDGKCLTCQIFAEFTRSIFGNMQAVEAEGRSLIPALTGMVAVFAIFYLGGGLIAGDGSDLISRWVVFYKLLIAMVAAIVVFEYGAVRFAWDYIYSLLFALANGVANSVNGSAVASGTACTAENFSGIYPQGAANALSSMIGTICLSHQMATSGLAHGFAMWTSPPGQFGGMIIFFICGTVLMAIYGWLMIILPLRFIDIMIRLAIVSILSPVYVLAATFKPFRGYFFTAMSVVLYAAAQFAILAIMFKLGDRAIGDRIRAVTTQVAEGDFLGVVGHAFVLIITALVFAAVLKSVPAIAAELTRSSNSGAGEGAAAATRGVAAPAVIGAKAAGAVAIAVPAGMAIRAAAMRGAGAVAAGGARAAGGALGRGVT